MHHHPRNIISIYSFHITCLGSSFIGHITNFSIITHINLAGRHFIITVADCAATALSSSPGLDPSFRILLRMSKYLGHKCVPLYN